GGAEGAAAGTGRPPPGRRALPPRGPPRRPADAREHRHALRVRPGRRAVVSGHGVRGRHRPGRLHRPARAAGPGGGPAHPQAGGAGAGPRLPHGHHPPRHQAGQLPADARGRPGRRQADRLRPGPGRGRGPPPLDARRQHGGHGGLPLARAGPRQLRGRRAQRHLQPGLHLLPHAGGPRAPPPTPAGGLGERIYKHMEAEPPDVRRLNPRVPDALWAVLRRMLAKNPEDRYQTPAELLEALQEVKYGPPPTPPEVVPPAAPRTPPPATRPPAFGGAGPPRLRKWTPPHEADPAALLGLSAEQVRTAAGQFDRACQARAADHDEYALELLLSACRLDPGNVFYRQTLRQVSRALAEQKRTTRRPGILT